MHFAISSDAVQWFLVTAHLHAEPIFIGVNAVAQGCCQLVGTAAQSNKACILQ